MTHPVISDDWTPEQAQAVYEFIDGLLDAIWSRYNLQIIERLQQQRVTAFETDDDDLNF